MKGYHPNFFANVDFVKYAFYNTSLIIGQKSASTSLDSPETDFVSGWLPL